MRTLAIGGVLFAARISIAAALLGGTAPLAAEPADHLQLGYLASFGNGSLEPSIDRFGIGPLKMGDTRIAHTNPAWTPQNGTIKLGITRPAALVGGGPVSAGLFATPVSFDAGSVVGLRATFIAPTGPHGIGTQWAAAVGARTGGSGDFFAETRVVAALTVRADGARLNVVGSSVPPNLPNVPQDIYDAIFDPIDPQPFTLELVVDRITGVGQASLKVGEFVVSHSFQFAAFKADSGPRITAVGPSITIANAPGQSASVRVRDFESLLPRAEAPNPAAAGCPPGWAVFNCRAVPN